MLPTLQGVVNRARRVVPRGWSPVLALLGRLIPAARRYRARLSNGDRMYLDLRESMCHPLFYRGGHPEEYGTEKLLRKVLPSGGIVADVGANIGYFTRIASKLVGPAGKVYAFEPMPAALRLLRMNCADLPNVELRRTAISDWRGEAEFYVRRAGALSSLEPDSNSRPVRAPVTTLDECLKQIPRLDFIKVDVEGFELEVLRGAVRTMTRHSPVVYFEFVERYAEQRGFTVETFREFFGPLGYSLRWVDHSPADDVLWSETPSEYIAALPLDGARSWQRRAS